MKTSLKRLRCFNLILQMPARGLDDAAETLEMMLEYYQAPVIKPKASPTPVSRPAVLSKRDIRPAFHIEED
jgi:hypothetical protein